MLIRWSLVESRRHSQILPFCLEVLTTTARDEPTMHPLVSSRVLRSSDPCVVSPRARVRAWLHLGSVQWATQSPAAEVSLAASIGRLILRVLKSVDFQRCGPPQRGMFRIGRLRFSAAENVGHGHLDPRELRGDDSRPTFVMRYLLIAARRGVGVSLDDVVDEVHQPNFANA